MHICLFKKRPAWEPWPYYSHCGLLLQIISCSFPHLPPVYHGKGTKCTRRSNSTWMTFDKYMKRSGNLIKRGRFFVYVFLAFTISIFFTFLFDRDEWLHLWECCHLLLVPEPLVFKIQSASNPGRVDGCLVIGIKRQKWKLKDWNVLYKSSFTKKKDHAKLYCLKINKFLQTINISSLI